MGPTQLPSYKSVGGPKLVEKRNKLVVCSRGWATGESVLADNKLCIIQNRLGYESFYFIATLMETHYILAELSG